MDKNETAFSLVCAFNLSGPQQKFLAQNPVAKFWVVSGAAGFWIGLIGLGSFWLSQAAALHFHASHAAPRVAWLLSVGLGFDLVISFCFIFFGACILNRRLKIAVLEQRHMGRGRGHGESPR